MEAMTNQPSALAKMRPTLLASPMWAMPTTSVEKDQRADQHLDQAQEDIRHDRDITRDLRGRLLVGIAGEDHVSDHDAQHHRDQDIARHRSFSCRPPSVLLQSAIGMSLLHASPHGINPSSTPISNRIKRFINPGSKRDPPEFALFG